MKAIKSTPTATAKESGKGLRSILVPLDFSEISQQALAVGVDFATRFGAELILAHVLETYPVDHLVGLPNTKKMNASLEDEARRRLESLARTLGAGNAVRIKIDISWGKPFQAICDAAERLRVDLIILTTHGYTGLKHAYLGSTTERVVRHSSRPVLVIPSRKK